MKNRSVLLLLITLTGVALTTVGCSAKHSHPGKNASPVFRINIGTEPPELDPIRVTDLTSLNVLIQIQRGLVMFDSQGSVVPAMAERWTISPDGKTYRFFLNPKSVWDDGQPVTAGQFVEGWKRTLSKKNASEYAFFLFDVVGAKAYFDGHLKTFDAVGIHALDAHTLEVRLNKPVAFFLSLLASPIAYPARLDKIAQYGESWTEAGHMPSNGPYRLSTWQHEEKIILTPNSTYSPSPFRGEGSVVVEMLMINDANTSVAMYEQGGLDFIETPSTLPAFEVQRLKKRSDFHTGNLHALFYLGFNTRKAPFTDKRVRQAFALATHRELIPQLLQAAQMPMTSWITPGLTGYEPGAGLPYNPRLAKERLTEAGYSPTHPLPPITLGFRTMYDIQKEAEIAQYSWKQTLGTQVRLENMDWKVYLSRLGSDAPQIFRLSWYVDYPDADSFMSLFTSGNGNNHTGWHSPQYDQWVKQAAETRNVSERQRLYHQAQKLLLQDDAVIVPLYASRKGYLLNPHFQGLNINGLNLLNLDQLRYTPDTGE